LCIQLKGSVLKLHCWEHFKVYQILRDVLLQRVKPLGFYVLWAMNDWNMAGVCILLKRRWMEYGKFCFHSIPSQESFRHWMQVFFKAEELPGCWTAGINSMPGYYTCLV
jgi:hypothetical protein